MQVALSGSGANGTKNFTRVEALDWLHIARWRFWQGGDRLYQVSVFDEPCQRFKIKVSAKKIGVFFAEGTEILTRDAVQLVANLSDL